MNTTMPDRGVKEKECAQITSLSRCFRWQLEREGKFPQRKRISSRSHFWLLSELQEWLQDPQGYSVAK